MFELTPHQQKKVKAILLKLERGNAFAYFEMRSGKTPTMYSVINSRKPKRVLIITEKNLKRDIYTEHKKWLKIDRSIEILNKKQDIIADICIVHNQQLKTHKDFISKIDFDLVFVDECSNFKNYNSAMFKALESFQFKHLLLLSGTPADKNWHFYSIVRLCDPNGLGADHMKEAFQKYYCKAYWERVWGTRVFRSGGSYNTEELMEKISPYTVRSRTKDAFKDQTKQTMEMCPIDPPEGMVNIEDDLLAINLISLKMAEGVLLDDSKDEALLETLKSLTITALEDIPEHMRQFVTVDFNEISKQRSELSIQKKPEILKALRELDLLDEDHKAKEPFLLYGYYRELLEDLNETLESSVLFYGGLTQKEKKQRIAAFKSGEKDIFIGNYISAGKGLTLPEAKVIVMIDFPWNYSDLRQTQARVKGVNQKNDTRFVMLPMRGTIDMQIMQKLIEKENTLNEYETILDRVCQDEV